MQIAASIAHKIFFMTTSLFSTLVCRCPDDFLTEVITPFSFKSRYNRLHPSLAFILKQAELTDEGFSNPRETVPDLTAPKTPMPPTLQFVLVTPFSFMATYEHLMQ